MKPSIFNLPVQGAGSDYIFHTLVGTWSRVEDVDQLAAPPYSVPDDVNEVDALLRVNQRLRKESAFLALTIQLTNSCNLKCTYCFEEHEKTWLGSESTDQLVEWVTASCTERPWVRHLVVYWFGGEPLLAVPAMKSAASRLQEVCQRLGVQFSSRIITNGVLVERLAPLIGPLGITDVQITLDGPAAEHDARRMTRGGGGTFHRILRGLPQIPGPVDLIVRCNIDARNLESAFDLVSEVSAMRLQPGVRLSVQPMLVEDFGGESQCYLDQMSRLDGEQFETLLDLEEAVGICDPPRFIRAFCNVDFPGSLVVNSKGRAGKCWAAVDSACEAVMTPSLRETSPSTLRAQQCATCVAFPVCMGGCAFRPVTDSGCRAVLERVARRARRTIERAEVDAL